MATEICERVRGSQAAELHRGLQSDGGLQPHAEAEGIGHDAWATDRLLELLKLHHPSHAPVAVLMSKAPIENPAPPVAILKADAPSPESAQGPECGAPPVVKGLNAVTTLMRAAARHSGYTVHEIKSHRVRAPLVRMRHIVMYLSYRLTSLSFPMIANLMGGRDHSTVLHGVNKIERLIKSDDRMAADIAAVRNLAIAADPTLDVDAAMRAIA